MARNLAPVSLSPVLHGGEKRQREESGTCAFPDGKRVGLMVQMEDFRSAVQDCELVDLGFSGPQFTWSNHRASGLVKERLDRALGNGAWVNGFPTAKVFHLVRASSDYAPVLVDVLGQRDRQRFNGGGSCIYRFEAMWLRDSRCEANISAWWGRSSGDSVEALRSSIDGLGLRLMHWSKSVFGEIPNLIRVKEKEL
ncbi:hypothetical protein LOK49_LG10G02003 [Camellia lanceoleosa]|uniref:Uncharacterized protein n=1 Tax=Camellia lanceoleosa TaxID=1840588 RepID=A0ACC0G545_9ERIC|nr:hypothetical protein LOK49_LG10G02003 [Camellia lanceoleosa]